MTEFNRYMKDLLKHPGDDTNYIICHFNEIVSGYNCTIVRDETYCTYCAYVIIESNHPINFNIDLVKIHGKMSINIVSNGMKIGIGFLEDSYYNPLLMATDKYEDPLYLKSLHFWTFDEVKLEIEKLAIQLYYTR